MYPSNGAEVACWQVASSTKDALTRKKHVAKNYREFLEKGQNNQPTHADPKSFQPLSDNMGQQQ